jgi:FG-GAP-like repeat
MHPLIQLKRATSLFLIVLGLVLLVSLSLTACPHGLRGPDIPKRTPADGVFYFHDLGHRCIDFGGRDSWHSGAPVYIYSCNGTLAQQVRVKEIDSSHDVELRTRSLDFCIGVKGRRESVPTPSRNSGEAVGPVAVGQPLELQTCNGSPTQRFALDGDSILMGAQTGGRVTRQYAIEPDQKRTPNRTPLVVAARELSDAEYFRYEALDHSARKPTNGFHSVSDEAALDQALAFGWGTVIEVDPGQPVGLKGPFPNPFPKAIHAGVTLRGYRKYTFQGPELHICTKRDQPIFMVTEDNVRITGLRLRGPVNDPRCQPSNVSHVAIQIQPTAEVPHVPIVFVDHLDIGYFTASAVATAGTHPDESNCPPGPLEFPRSTPVRVISNFFHHIERRVPLDSMGSVTGNGAFILNQGNVIYRTYEQSIAADPSTWTGYNAYDNFFLSNQRVYQVDMHSPGHIDGTCCGGDYFDVGWNTFLDTVHWNIIDSAPPCRFTWIHDNIFLQSEGKDDGSPGAIVTHTTDPVKHSKPLDEFQRGIFIWANTDKASNPTADLAVGDFDGDGSDDVFVGTGAAWYFSSGGAAEWRFLNRMPEHASALRFGDFDRDGRTDVIAVHGANVDISWGGLSPWQTINVVAWPISEIAVGDFDGDGIADLFLATGSQWFYAPGGRNWTLFADSSIRTHDLRFGDFTHAGHTQVLGISASHEWQIVRHIGGTWESLGPAGHANLADLVVGDFNGDGFADLARLANGHWEFISPGTGIGWTQLWTYNGPLVGQPIGHFDANATSDVIEWDGRDFDYAPGAKGPLVRLSRQDMK